MLIELKSFIAIFSIKTMSEYTGYAKGCRSKSEQNVIN